MKEDLQRSSLFISMRGAEGGRGRGDEDEGSEYSFVTSEVDWKGLEMKWKVF